MSYIAKETRLKVYEKYNGHCACCGREIEYKDMQVDHFVPLRNWDKSKSKTELGDFENLMPSCRKCNHYKRANGIETLRKMIEDIPKKLSRDSYIYGVGIKYGIIKKIDKPVKFYFEIVDSQEDK